MYDLIKKIIDKALDFIYPPRCMVCLEIIPLTETKWLCRLCKDLVKPIENPTCIKCGAPVENDNQRICVGCMGNKRDFYLQKNFALFVYDDIIRRLIHNFKFANHPEIARGIGIFIKEKKNASIFEDVDYLTYIPLHRKRQAKRGYNQALLIAREISGLTGIPIAPMLKRKRDTKAQSLLNYAARVNNVKDAFEVCGNAGIATKTIMLIDDIYTTGNTLNACAQALLKKGAKNVVSFTVAVAVKNLQINDENIY